jgi:hypothetical protein
VATSLAPDTAKKWLLRFGVVLLLGGAAHTAGVTRLYVKSGVPDANRVLLDVWIAEAQLAVGALFIKAARSAEPRPWTLGAALVIWSYAIPFLPVLVRRAPPIFWVPPSLYALVSLALVRAAAPRSERPPRRPRPEGPAPP